MKTYGIFGQAEANALLGHLRQRLFVTTRETELVAILSEEQRRRLANARTRTFKLRTRTAHPKALPVITATGLALLIVPQYAWVRDQVLNFSFTDLDRPGECVSGAKRKTQDVVRFRKLQGGTRARPTSGSF